MAEKINEMSRDMVKVMVISCMYTGSFEIKNSALLLDCDTEPVGSEGENDGPMWIIWYNCAALCFNCAA